MATRKHVHEETLSAPPDRVFAILNTPSAICAGWGAARAIVLPREGGIWTAAWGADEDSPDYITSARIKVFDPPRRLVLGDFLYYAKTGPLPFQADFTTEFSVSDSPNGAVLKVVQTDFR